MVNYHIVLTDGTERNVKCAEAALDQGALVLNNEDGTLAVCYAAGAWLLCEREAYDDHGYPSEPEVEPK